METDDNTSTFPATKASDPNQSNGVGSSSDDDELFHIEGMLTGHRHCKRGQLLSVSLDIKTEGGGRTTE